MKRLIMLLFCAVCTVSMTFAQDAKKEEGLCDILYRSDGL